MPRIVRRGRRVYAALGDGEPSPGSTLADTPAVDVGSQVQGIRADLQAAIATAERQKWIQIAATLAIPIAAAGWRWLLGKRTSQRMDL